MNTLLQPYISILACMSATVTGLNELLLFDLSTEEQPLIAQAHRTPAGERAVRKALPELLKEAASEEGPLIRPLSLGEMSLGKLSLTVIRDEAGQAAGAFCSLLRCDVLLQLQAAAEGLLDLSGSTGVSALAAVQPPLPLSLDLIDRTAAEYIPEEGKISKNDRWDLLCDLRDLGVFELKGAVARTAEVLGISEKSVYRDVAKLLKK